MITHMVMVAMVRRLEWGKVKGGILCGILRRLCLHRLEISGVISWTENFRVII